jgi:hypothetical protein
MAGCCDVVIGSNEQLFADHGYEVCWSNPMQSMVRSNEDDWSSAMQTSGQYRCF